MEQLKFYATVRHFPPIINGRINIVEFLDAAQDLVQVVDRLGKALAPAKYDMQGNIDKIKKLYNFDESSCLLDLMLNEKIKDKPGIESVVWLNRSFKFFEIVFQQLLFYLQQGRLDVSSKKIFTEAYEKSLKKYHNWVTQQIFTFVSKMGPSIPQFLKALEADEDLKGFEATLTAANINLHLVRCKIEDFVKDNDLFEE